MKLELIEGKQNGTGIMQIIICDESRKCLTQYASQLNCEQYSVQLLSAGINSLQELLETNGITEGCVIICGIYSEEMACECIKMMEVLRAYRADIKFIICIALLRPLDSLFAMDPDYMFSIPVNLKNIRGAVDSCFQDFVTKNKAYITVQRKGRINCIDAGSIVCVESHGRCIEIVLQQGQKITVYMQLREMQDKLPDYFIRCHQSYCVNLKQIVEYDCGKLLMHDRRIIPVSKRYRQEIRKVFEQYSQKMHFED